MTRPVFHVIEFARRCLRDRRGMSALELAIVAPILTGAVVALANLGDAAQQQIRLEQALSAGAQDAIVQWQVNQPTDGTLENDAKSAVTAALPSNWVVTVSTPTLSCMCWNSNTSARSATCIGASNQVRTCTGIGQTATPELYIALTASIAYSGTFLNTTITANYQARYQ